MFIQQSQSEAVKWEKWFERETEEFFDYKSTYDSTNVTVSSLIQKKKTNFIAVRPCLHSNTQNVT